MATTMKDVARRAGVDVSTVSLAINNDPRIRTETRERILAIAHELGYRKNFLARGLRSGKSFTIGAVAYGATALWGEILAGAQSVLAQRDYHLLLDYTSCGSRMGGSMQIEALKAKRIDGMLIAPPYDSDRNTEADDPAAKFDAYRSLRDENVPFVFVDRYVAGVDADIVAVDGAAGVQAATEYLIGFGHRSIAYIYSPHRMNTAQHERLQGYEIAMRGAGLKPRPFEAAGARADRGEEGQDMMACLLSLPGKARITAVIAATDSTAMGALRTIDEAGVDVPGDISIISVGGSPIMKYAHPPMTTVTLPMRELGVQAAHTLLARIEGDATVFRNIRLPTELTPRSSCGPPAGR